MRSEPRWITERALLLLHDESISEHGGLVGLRDEGMLQSALDRPRNRYHYEPDSDLAALAASYAYGLARNHPFADGNKRAAFLALGLFLAVNGVRLTASQSDATLTILALAAGDLSEEDLAGWIRRNCAPIAP